MLKIKTWRDPYDAGFSTTRPKEISINEGLTVLVGCNGAGKTTLLMNIKDQCRTDNIPCLHYDNLREGGSRAFEAATIHNIELASELYNASEGEAVKINFGTVASKIKYFLKTGFVSQNKEPSKDNRRVLLFDALDSGLSVDSVAEIRNVVNLILEDAKKIGMEVYIIISANEYEMARKAPCFDVVSGKYVELQDYEAYRDFIINSRKRKDKRNEASEKRQLRKAKRQ